MEVEYNETSFTAVPQPVDVLFDMETQDPDDFFTLCFLLSHPSSRLRGVTVYPGSTKQIGFIKTVLKKFNREDVLVGSNNPKHPKESISDFHFKLFNFFPALEPDDSATEVMNQVLAKYPSAVFFTGGPPINLEMFFKKHPHRTLNHWFAQGGFAADNVMPAELVLPKIPRKIHLCFCQFLKIHNS
eukprot:TRINITY_DN5491_c0_g1_i1.p1 TRINITY_DN5491_c0_g1~~TRINITY_DN5491_c0_g1_i1.p1  ORF type:complete len:186 (-),score=42.69 TRINITY_DN5491_c0_g1_i1:383-940(-)